ncbi:MAG: hypothetical protein COZ06_32365 [Armatimonadetes bacterium CG_4_10_14_3_um_filter_66_18]|nr:stage II sporulation protein M [Armatimonadota bacterium]OIO95160.1 MAG: hypothetical protein AUJ96_27375 [Armatimonadetes bacterium CG2_30_66_41]PIU92948.1 MAG: hypothetical protein COS65_15210 [Armatimonadetes bacterium CG06_land_8_20_14_3_00_66_21]PIX40297.1 MAG: hypothetical protein COZ57_26200 [Armatimonadetes bacterium CG_4_8_14_3_um_filter_66_20]PIY37658.1 MAG: hypothetical protein COZ06_32365 [Armatimonadetes bacterium CG_4_10_14_3_um_filter_66_18]PIZ33392.1 MAG: hypothetical protei
MTTNSGTAPSAGERLARLLDKIDQRGLKALDDEELLELGRSYRRAGSALSRARTLGLASAETERLNRLVGRAYGQLYVGEPRPRGTVTTFFLREFPRTVQANRGFFLAALGLFLAGGLLGGALTNAEPNLPDVIFGPGAAEGLESVAERYAGVHNWLPEETRPLASSLIMTNNLRVSFLAFATGVFFGLGTLYVLLTNGLVLGAAAAVVHNRGVDANFWAFVAPHGVLELTAIFLAGAAGLRLGDALLRPGPYGRLDSLRLAGREAVKLIMGLVAMLVIAAPIEAFLSPVPELPAALKFQFAAVVGVAEYAYLFLVGRGDKAASASGQINASSLSAR